MDFIPSFLQYTSALPSPEIFRLWSAITVVSGAVEKRVWADIPGRIYPNLFTLLVAPPGIGKNQAIDPGAKLWMDTKNLHVAPNNMTKASLIDALNEADRKILTKDGQLMEYHSLCISAPELGVLIPAHDLEFLSVVNHIYDNPPYYREKRRTSLTREMDIIEPQMTILAGSQPGFLSTLLPDEAWTMGFTSRLILIYSGKTPFIDLFEGPALDQQLYAQLVERLKGITDLMGCMQWEKAASNELRAWNKAGRIPVPEHSKLEHYVPRRLIHCVKLTIVSAISRSNSLIVTLEDVIRARDWLLEAERYMPDIFRHMAGRSDSQVILDMHYWMWQQWAPKKQPLHQHKLTAFLSTKVPADKIDKIIEVAERSGVIKKLGLDQYVPSPRHEFGVE